MVERKPIFYDQERRRWRRTRRVLEIVGGLFTLVLVVFIVNVFRKPELPDVLSAATHWSVHAIPTKTKPKVVRSRWPPRYRTGFETGFLDADQPGRTSHHGHGQQLRWQRLADQGNDRNAGEPRCAPEALQIAHGFCQRPARSRHRRRF